MSSAQHNGTPGYGVSGHENEKFLLGRMEGLSRIDMPVVTAAIPARTLVKIGVDGKTLEPVVASSDTVFGVLADDKAAGTLRTNVFTQCDVNILLVLPQGLDMDQLAASNSRIAYKSLIMSGLE
jgi:hypothetical protein